MVGLSTDFVFHGQYWLVYHPVLSVKEIMVGISPNSVCYWQYGWYLTQCCPSWTNWLAYQPVLSVMDNIGLFISLLCLS